MTWEEVIAVLEESKRQNEVMRDNPSTFWASHQMAEGVKNAKRRIEAFEIALTALRPVSREQVEKVPRCEHCKDGKSFDGQVVIMGNKGMFPLNFCPRCGSPLTDEAVEMVMERLEALKDGKAGRCGSIRKKD